MSAPSPRPPLSPVYSLLDSVDGRAFYQARIALLNRTAFFLSFGFFVLVKAIAFATSRHWLVDVVNASNRWHLTAVFVALSTWQLASRRVRSASVLVGLDAGSLALQVACYAAMAIVAPPMPVERVDLVVVLIGTVLQVSRAVLVPSSARRTIAVGVFVSLPLLAVSYHVGGYLTGDNESARFFTVFVNALWLTIAVVVASLTSRVIYGLRRQVREAQRLGQYTLEEKIGEGSMGIVYRASHALLRRPTAIKLLPPEKAGAHNLLRFEREVQLTSELSHPNTVSIFDYGHTPDGIFYYVMEYLDGLDLERLVELDGPQDPSRVVHILAAVCGALAEAHGIHLVHRDIKPANIIVCERGGMADFAKVVDFGLVKEPTEAAEGSLVAQAGVSMVVGTPLYLSPEAITAPERVDARSDLYAVGAVAYFLMTGTPVFNGRTTVEVCAQHLDTAPQAPSVRLGRELPSRLEQVVLACLEKDPGRRPQGATELKARLEASVPRWTDEQAREWWRRLGTARLDRRDVASNSLPHVTTVLTVDLVGRSGTAQ